ncbi:MAG: CAP domain-containing protein [Myxococcota bacterium]
MDASTGFLPYLEPDTRLDAAAREHAIRLLKGEKPMPSEALRRLALGDPWVLAHAEVGPSAQRLRAHAARATASWDRESLTHVGSASLERGRRYVLVVFAVQRWVDWVTPAWGEWGVRIEGRSLGPKSVRWFWSTGCRPDLHCRADFGPRPAQAKESGALSAAIQAAELSVVEAVADVGQGPEVIGLWFRPGLRLQALSQGPESPAAWWSWLRAQKGLPVGRAHPGLQRAAELHADDICTTGRARHVDAFGRSPEARALAQAIRFPVAENTAIAKNLRRAHRNLMVSPSHRQVLFSRDVQTYGMSAHHLADRVCVVQMFGLRSGGRPVPTDKKGQPTEEKDQR